MNPLVNLAKQAVENYVKEGKIIEVSGDFPKEFLIKRAGVFVSINTKYKILNTKYSLRGCVGTYLPTRKNIVEEIIHNAIAAATEDFRFGPIQKDELPELSYAVYILSEPELVRDIKSLDPRKYGIIVKAKQKAGLLLPNLEGIDTIEKQISLAHQKVGIDAVREEFIIYRFTVEKFQ